MGFEDLGVVCRTSPKIFEPFDVRRRNVILLQNDALLEVVR